MLPAVDLVAGYRAGTLSPVEATLAVLDRIREYDGVLNAFIIVAEEEALAAARASEARWKRSAPIGLIDGVPTTIKDVILMKGHPTRRGSKTTPSTAETEDAPRGRRAQVAGGSPSPSQVMMESEQNAEIEAAIARLPEHYQMVIHLRNKQDLSFQEIADKLESTPEAVRKLWSRGILQLQKEMESRSDSTHRSNP